MERRITEEHERDDTYHVLHSIFSVPDSLLRFSITVLT
jgi:hypothetical protein